MMTWEVRANRSSSSNVQTSGIRAALWSVAFASPLLILLGIGGLWFFSR